METWKAVIVKHLGRKILKHCESLMMNIIAVDEGIKPAYLYDVGAITASQLVSLVKEVRQENLISNNLNVLEIEMDYLVVNVQEFLHEDRVIDLQRRLIDVSDSTIQPCVVDSPCVTNKLVTVVNDIRQNLDYTRVKHYIISSVCCNFSSLFGLLLNYPVIYWYKNPSVGNCLSMEKLKCVKVTVTYSEQKNLETCQNKAVCNRDLTLYSFSYPYCIHVHCKALVDAWFLRVQDKISESAFFAYKEYITEDVILEAVCL